MKRNIIIIALLLILLIPSFVGATDSEFSIFINKEQLTISSDLGEPFIDKQSRTQIPLRAISEELGYQVDWNADTGLIIIKSDAKEISLTIGSKEVNVSNGENITMDTEAVVIEERTYVPLRFVSEALGYAVQYQWQGKHVINIIDTIIKPDFYRPAHQDLPDEIKNWIELSKELPLVQEKMLDGKRYVLITDGTKPTGGYGVEVREISVLNEELMINVKHTAPGPDDAVTQAITYPYDLIVVENQGLPLKFVDVDDEDRFYMNLLDIDEIDSSIVASSEWIKMFEPKPNETVAGTIIFSGLASVFEGTVSYELIDETGEIIESGFTMAAMGDWAYFEGEIEIPEELSSTQLFLELYSESMKDSSKMFTVTIPLTI